MLKQRIITALILLPIAALGAVAGTRLRLPAGASAPDQREDPAEAPQGLYSHLLPQIRLVVDPGLLTRYDEIAFNAGRLDCSMVLNSVDYVRIAQPAQHLICV